MLPILLSLLACNEVEPQPVPVVDWADVPCDEKYGLSLPDSSHVVNVLGCVTLEGHAIPEGQYVSAQCGDAEFYRVTWIEQP